MNCPNDTTTLVMTERSGIEIDYCPQCRGVWLDRGELDKLIERSSGGNFGQAQDYSYTKTQQQHRTEYQDGGNKQYPKKKKESFLSDIFDF